MKDFLGNEIVPNSWLCKSGTGNTSAEYGMILHRVHTIANDKILTTRLCIKYPNGKVPGNVSIRKAVLTNQNGVTVISPPYEFESLFIKAETNTLTENERIWIGKWLHGTEHQKLWI